MKQTMDKQDDRLLREALQRRADKVPALSDEFQEGVLAKLQANASSPKPLSISHQEPLSISPRVGEGLSFKTHGAIAQKTEGEGLRHGGWRTWAWVASVAAVVVIGFFVFQRETPSPIPPRGEGIAPNVPSMVAETTQSSPSLQGRVGGGSSSGQASGSSASSTPSPQGLQGVGVPGSTPSPRGGQGKGSRAGGGSSSGQVSVSSAATAPTLADLYAAIDQMTNEAIEEANRLMAEALVREYTDDEPS